MHRRNLFVSLIMLVVTAVALTTASYAWFVSNVAVTVTGLEINVTAAEGIQVSTDAVNWRATLSISDIIDPGEEYPNHTNQVPTTLEPVSTIGVVDDEEPGAFSFFDGFLVEGAETTLTTTAAAAEAAGTEGNYVAFDLFIRSGSELDIYLESPSGIVYVPVDEEETVGLEWASRIGFLYQGTQSDYEASDARALFDGTSADQTIFEPNARTHTVLAISAGANPGQVETYYGVKAAGEGLHFDDPLWGDFDEFFEEVTTLTVDTDDPPYQIIEANRLFTIGAGISKVRIYIWIEGQDIDCENSISHGLGNVAASITFMLD